MELDYSGIASQVRGLGPGRRVVLWVRGCTIGCPGCMTKDLWAKGTPRPLAPLADELVSKLNDSDGLTISGGEPFQQAAALAELLAGLRSRIDIEILCYSGYTYEYLRKQAWANDLLGCLDVLMDGPFMSRETNNRLWRGSDNQTAIKLSDRGRRLEQFDEEYGENRELQIQRLSDGNVRIIGIPRRAEMEKLKSLIGERGLLIKETP